MLSTPCESEQICTDPDRHSRIRPKLTSQNYSFEIEISCGNKINVANESLKVEKPLLKSSSEMDKFSVYNQYRTFPRYEVYRDGDKFSC